MVVLALDTTNATGSCAVVRDTVVLHELVGDPAQDQASRLPGDLMRAMGAAGVTLHDVDLFAVATGPGSFTGLRVGIATMQGLAFAMTKPLIGVSGFEALRVLARAPVGTAVAVWIDAWRGEVYSAVYDGHHLLREPEVAAPTDLLEQLPDGPVVLIGDGAAKYRPLITTDAAVGLTVVEATAPPIAAIVGGLAAGRAAEQQAADPAGTLPPPHAIRPVYVRRPDAEISRTSRAPRLGPPPSPAR